MPDDEKEIRSSLKRIKNISRWISQALKVVFFVLVIFWVVFALLSVASLNGIADVNGLPSSFYELVVFLLIGIVVISIVVIGIKVFSDVARGKSPFSMTQVKRLRAVAALLLAYMLLEVLLSPGIISAVDIAGLDLGYVVQRPDVPSISINLGALLGAIVFWALSLIFEYGVLLQEFSDDTL